MTVHSRNPRTLTLRYLAWAMAKPRGGNISVAEMAERLDVPERRLHRVLRGEKWALTLRSSTPDPPVMIGSASEDQAEAQRFIGGAA